MGFQEAIQDNSWKGIFNAVSPGLVTNAEFTQTLGDVLKRPTVIPAPEFAIKLALGEMSQVLLEGQGAVPKHALDKGYNFKYSELKQALSTIVS